MTSHKRNYTSPSCDIHQLGTEQMLAASPDGKQTLSVGGTDTQATQGTNEKTWGEVKANTIDWDE